MPRSGHEVRLKAGGLALNMQTCVRHLGVSYYDVSVVLLLIGFG
jgi:hypothetical protein